MKIVKKLKHLSILFLVITLISTNAHSTEECFERTSRAIFKFNMALDDIF